MSDAAAPRRCLIFANPKAGALNAINAADRFLGAAGERPPCLDALQAEVERANLNALVRPVPPRESMAAAVEEAISAGFNVIAAAGGDGTVRAVAQAMVGKRQPLGIIPAGTDNNFARSLGLPIDVAQSLEVLRDGTEEFVDVGRIGEEYFIEGAGVGIFADAVQMFGAEEPRKYQIFRELKLLFATCWNPHTRRLIVSLDGVPATEEVIMVTVANCVYLGMRMPVAPEASLHDGLFDVIIVGAMTRWELARFIWALFRRNHLALPGVRHAVARVVEIEKARFDSRPLPVHADDFIATQTPVRMEVVPAALRVIVPPDL